MNGIRVMVRHVNDTEGTLLCTVSADEVLDVVNLVKYFGDKRNIYAGDDLCRVTHVQLDAGRGVVDIAVEG